MLYGVRLRLVCLVGRFDIDTCILPGAGTGPGPGVRIGTSGPRSRSPSSPLARDGDRAAGGRARARRRWSGQTPCVVEPRGRPLFRL